MRKILYLALALMLALSCLGENISADNWVQPEVICEDGVALAEIAAGLSSEVIMVELGEDYYLWPEVALYLHAFSELPENYITKNDAMDLGWDSRAGNLWVVAPGMVIGGDRFGNYERQLPTAKGRKYYECDVDYEGGYRANGRRIVFSSDGLIYITFDHYDTFTLLYNGWYEEGAKYVPAD